MPAVEGGHRSQTGSSSQSVDGSGEGRCSRLPCSDLYHSWPSRTDRRQGPAERGPGWSALSFPRGRQQAGVRSERLPGRQVLVRSPSDVFEVELEMAQVSGFYRSAVPTTQVSVLVLLVQPLAPLPPDGQPVPPPGTRDRGFRSVRFLMRTFIRQ